jgi:hypothetical protein
MRKFNHAKLYSYSNKKRNQSYTKPDLWHIPFMELAFVWNMYQCKLFIGGHVEPICIYHEDKKN